MHQYPINLDISGRKAVVVGGGTVAERKCLSLLEAGAAVTVVSPALSPGLAELHRSGKLSVLARHYLAEDLTGALLVFAATDDRAVNRTVAVDAQRCGILVCVVDEPEEGTFTSPAVVRRGDLLLSISTSGRCPALARRIRQELESRFGPEYGEIVAILGTFRQKLLTEGRESAYSIQLFDELLDGDLSRLLKPGERERLFTAIPNLTTKRTPTPAEPEEFS